MQQGYKPISHLVFSPDGDRRYAARNAVPFREAYDRAFRKIVDVAESSFSGPVPVNMVSIWILAEYNLNREPQQVKEVTEAVAECIIDFDRSDLVRQLGIQVRAVGELPTFFEAVPGYRGTLEQVLTNAGKRQGKPINFLVAYNGDKELMRALQRCLEEGVEPTFGNASKRWSIPPVELFIRTGYPGGFNRFSALFPGADQAKTMSTPTFPQNLTRTEFTRMLLSYATLVDSYEKLSPEQKKRVPASPS